MYWFFFLCYRVLLTNLERAALDRFKLGVTNSPVGELFSYLLNEKNIFLTDTDRINLINIFHNTWILLVVMPSICVRKREMWNEPVADKLMTQNQGKTCNKCGLLLQWLRSECRRLISHQVWVFKRLDLLGENSSMDLICTQHSRDSVMRVLSLIFVIVHCLLILRSDGFDFDFK